MSILARVSNALGVEALAAEHLAGGDLGGATRVRLAGGESVVVKTGPLVEREGHMLGAIAATGVPAPRVRYAEKAFLIMDFVASDGRAGWLSLAGGLAQLHAPEGPSYGWPEDYAFGVVPIVNTPSTNWADFWAEHRLLSLQNAPDQSLDQSLVRRLESLARHVPDILPAHPPAALLHGDLWGGNFLVRQGELAALIDPACYYGDCEVDFAMLQIFDRPPPEFFEAAALAEGWRERRPVYQLWPMLVHLRLFGSAYRGRVESLLAELGF